MSDPLQTDKNRLPAPAQGFRGVENSDPGGRFSFATIARLWRPRNTVNEQPACTVSRFAHRIVTADGQAKTAEELGGTVGGQPNDAFGTSANADGGLDLTLWNQTRNVFQRVRIQGTPGNEAIIFIDL